VSSRPVRLVAFCGAEAWGGAEIVLGHLLASLDERVQPLLLGVDPEVVERIAARRPGMPSVLVPPIRSKRDVRAIAAHRRALARARPDLVQVNLPVPFAAPYTILAALTVRPARVIAVEHLPMATPWPNVERLLRVAAPRLAAHVAVSGVAARQVEALGELEPGSVRVLWNGVPHAARHQGVRRAPGPLRIGAVGRLEQQKGFDVLLHALTRVPEARLVVIGDGAERPALEQLAKHLAVWDRVVFLGWVDAPHEHLLDLDVLAVPSRHEGLPLVLLEAMAAGVPVVATRVGGIPEAVDDGATGLLVPPDDQEALTSALQTLERDPRLRARLAGAAQDRARRDFTSEAMARRYEDLYDEILEAPGDHEPT